MKKENNLEALEKDIKKETKNAFNFLQKNAKISFLILGWLMIISGSLSLFNIISPFNSFFWGYGFRHALAAILAFLSSIFFIYTGFGILNYRKWVLTSLSIYLFFSILSFLFLFNSYAFSVIIKTVIVFLIIFWWIHTNKKMFKK